MEDLRGTCPSCNKQGLRLTEKGLIWPHFSKQGGLCPPAAPKSEAALVSTEDIEPRSKKRKKAR